MREQELVFSSEGSGSTNSANVSVVWKLVCHMIASYILQLNVCNTKNLEERVRALLFLVSLLQ